MTIDMLRELSIVWQVTAEMDKGDKPGRRETLRECADMLQMLLEADPATSVLRHGHTTSSAVNDFVGPKVTLRYMTLDQADAAHALLRAMIGPGVVIPRPASAEPAPAATHLMCIKCHSTKLARPKQWHERLPADRNYTDPRTGREEAMVAEIADLRAALAMSASTAPALIQALETGDERESPNWFDIKASEVQSYTEEGYKVRKLYEHADTPASTAATQPERTSDRELMSAAIQRASVLATIGMEFGANLCHLDTKTIKGVEYLARDNVMSEVVAWRTAFDKAPKVDSAAVRAALAIPASTSGDDPVRAALEFYAKETAWDAFVEDEIAAQFDRNEGSDLGRDRGAMARAALNQLRGDK